MSESLVDQLKARLAARKLVPDSKENQSTSSQDEIAEEERLMNDPSIWSSYSSSKSILPR